MNLLIRGGTLVTASESREAEILVRDGRIAAVGSGGAYALAAARALLRHTELGAEDVVREALGVASEICIYTNDSLSLVSLP